MHSNGPLGLCLQFEFYRRFKDANPDVFMVERAFGSLWPFFVKTMKERNTCCCIYHVQLKELCIAMNNMRIVSRLHDKGACNCQCKSICCDSNSACGASMKGFSRLIDMWEAIVCPKNDLEEWHAKKCLFGQCGKCGINIFPFCPIESDGSNPFLVKWRRFALESTMS